MIEPTQWTTDAGATVRAERVGVGPFTRRQLILGGATAGMAFLVGCGSSADTTSTGATVSSTATTSKSTTPTAETSPAMAPDTVADTVAPSTDATEPATPATSADVSAFPVTIPHAFGTTTLDAAPQRIVVVGFKEQDYFIALGVVPVAIREWFGKQPHAVWPWAAPFLDGAEPEVLPRAELNVEQILAMQPDLIVGLSAGLTEEDYDKLTQLAPTIPQPSTAGDYSITWQEMTRIAGQILGKVDAADAMVSDLEARIEQTRAEHPEFEGASTILASAVGGEYYLYSPDATGALVLESLGLTMSTEVSELTDNDDAYYLVSQERFDLFDVDVAVWSEAATDEGPAALLASPIYQNLDVRRNKREVFLGELNGAMVFSSVLSLPYVLDNVVPQLSLAIDGDPATTSTLGAA